MRIAVISDTHNRMLPSVVEAIRGADEIWHLGDVMLRGIIDELHTLSPRVRVVRGNCDEYTDWPIFERFEIHGVRIHLEHIPLLYPPADTDLFLHGHTHVPRDETVAGVRYLNPGTVGKANKGAPPSFAWLTIEESGEITWKVVPIQ